MLGDGAHWIWNIADEHFPGAQQIVDLYHAREHYWKAANACSALSKENFINGRKTVVSNWTQEGRKMSSRQLSGSHHCSDLIKKYVNGRSAILIETKNG